MNHCQGRGQEIITGEKSHIYKYEQGGAAQVSYRSPLYLNLCLNLQKMDSITYGAKYVVAFKRSFLVIKKTMNVVENGALGRILQVLTTLYLNL